MNDLAQTGKRPHARERVLCVALNCGIDKVYDCRGFALTGIHQPARWLTCAGGKAVNQARMLHALGIDVLVTGFAGGFVGRATEDQLRCEGIPHDFERVQDESRLAITVIDPERGVHTEVNELGPHVTSNELADFIERYSCLLADVCLAAFAGSAPPGVGPSIYGQLIRMAKARGVATFLDARGEWLRQGVLAGPDMVKPNQAELGHLLGRVPSGIREMALAAAELCARGVRQVVVTLGADGALGVSEGVALHGWLEPVPVESAVGSGDAFAAALSAGWVRGAPLEESLRRGIACGTASAMRLGPAFVYRDEVDCLADRVRMEPVPI
ncbi:MAG TPA: 1-phosphofructokinase family hexose kinase [Armatimonadota bacterium]|nr:1-phosphofructokinase family hexose kinase [Armatimonadota bacterium]